MRTFTRIFGLIVIGCAVVTLSGCWATLSVSCKLQNCDNPQATGTIGTGKGPGGGGVINNIAHAFSSDFSFDASQASFDLTGTDYDVGDTGNIALTLLDANGNIIAAQAFPWTRSGNIAKFANPAEVNAWAAQYPSAASANMDASAGSIPGDGASHTLAIAEYYQSVKEASVSRSFPAMCENSRLHRIAPCPQ